MGQGFDGNTSRMSVPVNDETEGKAIRPRSGRFRVSDPGPAGVAALNKRRHRREQAPACRACGYFDRRPERDGPQRPGTPNCAGGLGW